jgi:heat shock protein HslJ
MKPVILMLAATTLVGAAPSPPAARYTAGGSEPFWSFVIERGRIIYNPGTGEPTFTLRAPPRQAVRNGWRYVTPRLVIDIRHVRCEDEAERYFVDTVRVTTDGPTYSGCGGAALPPESLADTDWTITAIGGTPVRGDGYNLQFREGRVSGRVGCNEFSGTYREMRPRLRFGPMAVTRMACPGPRMAFENRVLRILAGPVRMSFFEGDSLVLTGNGGTMRLQP